eukprot:Gb_15197 [translate_table: standard]
MADGRRGAVLDWLTFCRPCVWLHQPVRHPILHAFQGPYDLKGGVMFHIYKSCLQDWKENIAGGRASPRSKSFCAKSFLFLERCLELFPTSMLLETVGRLLCLQRKVITLHGCEKLWSLMRCGKVSMKKLDTFIPRFASIHSDIASPWASTQ